MPTDPSSMGLFVAWASAIGPPTVAAMPVRLNLGTVAINEVPLIISSTARQALLRRLQHVRETANLRASFSAVYPAVPVELRPGQRTALVRILESWALDLDGHEPIPQELLDLRDALVADVHDSGSAHA